MQPQEIIIETFPSTNVHDLCFDWYGNRLAACTSDRKIKIFIKQNSKWRLQYDFLAHEDITHKVKWAHPDFGSIIASCSFDKTVIIWEEPKTNILMNQPEIIENSDRPWIIRAKLSDSKESIEDIKFGPKHRGLILCTAATEGVFRIYEAPDIMNLGAWKLTNEVEVSSFGISAISWSKNILGSTMLAIGCKDKMSNYDKKFMIGDKNTPQLSPQITNLLYVFKEKEDGWSSGGKQLSFPHNSDHKNDFQHKQAVNDVSWAPNMGRSFEILASCGKDGLFLWYIRIDNSSGGNVFRGEKLQEENGVLIWKLSWNIMGTVLATSDSRDSVKLWKQFDEKWSCFNCIREEEGEEDKKDFE